MRNIRMFCLDVPRCFFSLEHSAKQSLNLCVKVLPDHPHFRQILCFLKPVAANGYCLDCLPRKLQIVGICALMVLSILNLCFQFAAIWFNGFCTEQSCKQAYIIIAILHISVLPFVWNCSSSGYIFFFFLWVWLVKSFITDNQSLLKQLEKSRFCSWVIYSNLEIQSAFPSWCQRVARLLTIIDKILLIQFTYN